MQDLDFNREVVCQPADDGTLSLSLNMVRGKCKVIFSEPNQSVSDAMDNLSMRNKRHVYICRYKIVNRNGKLSLVAIGDPHHHTETPSKLTVSPIKIVNKVNWLT